MDDRTMHWRTWDFLYQMQGLFLVVRFLPGAAWPLERKWDDTWVSHYQLPPRAYLPSGRILR